jgi:hypothetical protein
MLFTQRKTKERARKGQFVGTEVLGGHIFVVWIPEEQRDRNWRSCLTGELGQWVKSPNCDRIRTVG